MKRENSIDICIEDMNLEAENIELKLYRVKYGLNGKIEQNKESWEEITEKIKQEPEKQELEKYKNRAYAGRKKHDSAWMQSYNAFVVQYEKGKTIMEIVEQGDISRRTAYRYKAYYKKLKEKGMAVDKQD